MEWIELDGWQRPTGRCHEGTYMELRAQLLAQTHPDGKVSNPIVTDVLLRAGGHQNEKVRTSVVTLRTPWGAYRWIPRPRSV